MKVFTVEFDNGCKMFVPAEDEQEAEVIAVAGVRSMTGLPKENCVGIKSVDGRKVEPSSHAYVN